MAKKVKRGYMIFTNGTHGETEMVDDYRNIQSNLEVDVFTIVNIKIGGRNYTLYCDDEGLLKDEVIFTAICTNAREYYIAGNILIFKHHGSYNKSLDDKDIEIIKANMNPSRPHPNVAENILRFEF